MTEKLGQFNLRPMLGAETGETKVLFLNFVPDVYVPDVPNGSK